MKEYNYVLKGNEIKREIIITKETLRVIDCCELCGDFTYIYATKYNGENIWVCKNCKIDLYGVGYENNAI